MLKYIVFWVVTTMTQVPCPDVGLNADAYGRTTYPTVSCCVLHYGDATLARNSKEFDTLEEARAFVAKGERQNDLSDFEIKELDAVRE